ncbi:MAG: LptF/LptG family permease [Verrucomicrobiota bacterium]|nr:LptF/LptG family permease [Verrucomicrobiota bacterium]
MWIVLFFFSVFFLSSILLLFLLSEEYEKIIRLISKKPLELILTYIVPSFSWLSAISCFSATILTFVFLERHREWSTLKSCSICPRWIIGAIFLLSIFISVINLLLIYNKSLPADFLGKQNLDRSSLKIKDGNDWVWYFQDFDPKLKKGINLQLYIYDDRGQNVARVRCEKAYWDQEMGWRLESGIFWSYQTDKGILIPNDSNDSLAWVPVPKNYFLEDGQSQIAPLRKSSFHSLRISQIGVNPLPHFWVKENPADLSLSEISSIISNYPDQSSALLSPFRYKYAQLMFNALNCAIVTFLALFLVSGNYLIKVEFLVRSILCGLVIFYLLKVSCLKLGEKGLINPWVGVTLPLVGVLVSFALFRRSKLVKT